MTEIPGNRQLTNELREAREAQREERLEASRRVCPSQASGGRGQRFIERNCYAVEVTDTQTGERAVFSLSPHMQAEIVKWEREREARS